MALYRLSLLVVVSLATIVTVLLSTSLSSWKPLPLYNLHVRQTSASHVANRFLRRGALDTPRVRFNGTAAAEHANDKRDDWSTAVQNGHDMLTDMLSFPNKRTNADATWEDFNGPGELTDQQKMAGESYGWLITRGEDDTPAGLTDAFKKKNIPLGNKNVKRYAEQEIPFKNCHGDQQATLSHYTTLMNPTGKSLTALSSYSPPYQIKTVLWNNEPPSDWTNELPTVWKHSDVVWLLWEDACRDAGKNPKDLKYIFRHTIVTAATKRFMERAVGADHDKLDLHWPGREFRYGDQAFFPLLTTAHGRLIYNLVMQHKDGLQGKRLDSVTVFTTDVQKNGANSYHMLFTLSGPGNTPP